MGLDSSHALGLALGRPDKRIICLQGDGSLLMNLGCLVTIAAAAPKNLVHIVVQNGTYEANGSHPIPNTEVEFAAMARAAGYAHVHDFSELANFEQQAGHRAQAGRPGVRDLARGARRSRSPTTIPSSTTPRAAPPSRRRCGSNRRIGELRGPRMSMRRRRTCGGRLSVPSPDLRERDGVGVRNMHPCNAIPLPNPPPHAGEGVHRDRRTVVARILDAAQLAAAAGSGTTSR